MDHLEKEIREVITKQNKKKKSFANGSQIENKRRIIMSVKVINGVNSSNLNLAGQRISEVVQSYQEILGISDDQTIKVNGVEVTADYVLDDADTIEFVKEAGQKGSDTATVRVQSGVNTVNIQVEDGTPVREVLERAAELLGFAFDSNTTVNLNGSATSSDTPITNGDRIEVKKDAGSKG